SVEGRSNPPLPWVAWGQPFSEQIDRTPIPPQFRELVVDPFDGSQDPHVRLQAFQTQVYINGGDDLLSCKLFPSTLRGFSTNKAKHLEVANLFDIKQTKHEILKQYLRGSMEPQSRSMIQTRRFL
ncbi:hypothetical protein CR513_59789, partial [Mucuna pruriens]